MQLLKTEWHEIQQRIQSVWFFVFTSWFQIEKDDAGSAFGQLL